jgi:hypothetical protein
VRPEGLRQSKIPMTLSGIEPMTFRLVTQCLNKLYYHMHHVAQETMQKPNNDPSIGGILHVIK